MERIGFKQIRLDQIRLDQIRLHQITLDQITLDQIKTHYDLNIEYIRLDCTILYIRLDQEKTNDDIYQDVEVVDQLGLEAPQETRLEHLLPVQVTIHIWTKTGNTALNPFGVTYVYSSV